MSIYANMRELEIRRPILKRSTKTGQVRESGYETFRLMGGIVQNSQSDIDSNDQRYNKAYYTLTTYDNTLRKGDTVYDGHDTYTVQYFDPPRRRGPRTAQLERVTPDD